MLVRELLEAKMTKPDYKNWYGNIHFGFEHKPNATKAAAALKKADVEFDSDTNGGITYFYFDTKSDMKKAIKIVTPVIDASKESEWGSSE